MKRHTKGSVLDISIRGDELEHNRIQLENNLQHTDLSFRLSSASDDDDGYNNNNSIEYPRHNSEPNGFPDFASFDQQSRDQLDGDTHSQIHPWSYRTADDEGINPYGGETMSTAAHHASALTISAGLGGGRGARREVSLSGAEYDPERPLQNMIAGVDSKISAFDVEASRSKYPGIGSVTFDPLVVDSTAELDRVLQSGYAPTLNHQSVPLQSPLHSSSSSSASDSDSGQPHSATSRPKLSDALRRVSFSPVRPRSAQSNRSDSSLVHHEPIASPLSRTDPLPSVNTSHKVPIANPSKCANIFPSYASSPAPKQPEVRFQPPTPSSAGSNFARMARGLTRELEAEQQSHLRGHEHRAEGSRPASVHVTAKNEHDSRAGHVSILQPTPRRVSSLKQPKPRGKLHLPDVTGLTSAVESPAKTGSEYRPYHVDSRPSQGEARLLKTLSAVQSKLQHLEEENGISRRRVRELELELDACKRDVDRERTKVMEREEIIVQQQRDASTIPISKKNKGKGRAKDVSMDTGFLNDKYREAVEEKRALEALITSLRTHLTRLTSELSSHQELLTELRALRDSDCQALKQKSVEVDRLKVQVEKLAGEVEVLRGVVEEGLRERRAVRDISVVQAPADLGMSEDVESEEEGSAAEAEATHEEEDEGSEGETTDDEDAEPFDPLSILESARNVSQADRTMRTDHATLGSSNLGTTPGGRFVDSKETGHFSAEIEDSNPDESGSVALSQAEVQPQSHHRMRSRSPSPSIRRTRRSTAEDVTDPDEPCSDDRGLYPAAADLSKRARNLQGRARPHQYPQPSSSRPPSPAQAPTRTNRRARPHDPSPIEETPFPQIRGAHLERLFFSAPEHNAKTCTVCHRRRHRSPASPSWLPSRFRGRAELSDGQEEDEDEGFAEGSEEPEHERSVRGHKGKHREHVTFSQEPGPWRQQAEKNGLPPQTVVARVIRELEDDFTHYKSIYVELADQYKDMDAASNVPKRNILARHLREVVDILEQKGDQIASLYDLLSFKDKPVSESVLSRQTHPTHASSWGRS